MFLLFKDAKLLKFVLLVYALSPLTGRLYAGNEVLGEIQLIGATKVEKSSGVWVDGQYLGYLKELKGSKKILLLPGEHEIAVRQAGYKDFTQKVVLEPGQKHTINVAMEKDPQAQYPEQTAQVKMSVSPNRAAVFVNESYVGHVDEFDGPGQALLLAPGKHKIKISLPGYQTFETEVNLLANQKFELKTDLFKGSITQAGPLIKEKSSEGANRTR
jgi:PEGA domain